MATDFTETITLLVDEAGSLSGDIDVAAVNGVATFTDVVYTATADGQSFTIDADDEGGLAQANANTLTSDVVATKLVISGVSGDPDNTVEFGDDITLTVTAKDVHDIVDTDEVSTFSIATRTNNDCILDSTNNTGTLSSGTATITNLNITAADKTAVEFLDGEGIKILVQDTGVGETLTQHYLGGTLTIDYVATQLKVTTQPTGAVDETALTQQPVVKAVDANNNVDTANSTEVITASTATSGAAVGGTTTATMSSGVATFAGLRADVNGTFTDGSNVTLTFNDDGGFAGLGDFAAVDADATPLDVVATKLVWTQDPSSVGGCVSGLACDTQGIIVARDAHDNQDTDKSGDVAITVKSGGGALVGSTPQAMADGTLTTSGIGYTATADNEAFVLTATLTGITAADTGSVDSDVLATQLVFTTQPSATVESGVVLAQQPVLEARDGDGAKDEDFTSTITLATDEAGTLGGTLTEDAVAGEADFTGNGILYTNSAIDHETFQLDATADGVTGATSDSVNPNVTADEIVLTTAPTDIAATNGDVRNAIVFATQPIVSYQKDGIIDTDVTDTVTASLKTEAGTLGGTLTESASSGVANFGGNGLIYTLDAGEDDQQAIVLTFTDDDGNDVDLDESPIDSASLTVDVVATKFLVTLSTNAPVAGVADTLTLTAADANDDTDTDYDPSGLTFNFLDSESDGLASHVSPDGDNPTIPESATVISAFSSGVADLATFTLVKAETLGVITVNDGNGLTGDSASVAVRNAAASAFRVTPETLTPDTGTAYDLTITAVDEFGNTVSGANGAATHTGLADFSWTATSPTVSPDSYTFLTGDAGNKILSNVITFNTVESGKTITASDYRGSITGTSDAITIGQGGDVDSPTISDVSVVVTQETAAITFTSDEDGQGEVSYSYDSFTPVQTSQIDLTAPTPATITLGGLECGTEYDYTIWVEDQSNNNATSTGTFTTSACEAVTTPFVDVPVAKVQKETFEFDSWENGHEWKMLVTLPDAHNSFALKFDEWVSGDDTVDAAGNMRYYSEQIDSGTGSEDTPVSIATNWTYPAHVTIDSEDDIDSNRAGIQTYVRVLWNVPSDTPTGNYSSKFKVITSSIVD